MGAVNFSIDIKLVETLKKVLSLDIFVETGTFEGDTIEKVKDLFNEIHSVELSEEYYNRVRKRFKSFDNIHLYLDSSENFLKKIRPILKEKSVLYWLDAHWCVADRTAGEKSQCPLLEELTSIKVLNEKSTIIIDDARLFIAPPPSPHEITHWPDINSVLKIMSKLSSVHEVMILNDTIIFFPHAIKGVVHDYAYNNSINWLTVLDKSRDYDKLLEQLREKEEKIISLSNELVGKEKEIIALSNELQEKEEKIISLSNELVGKEKEIIALSNELQEKEEKINAFSNELAGKEKEIIALPNELQEKEEKIILLSNELIEKEKEINFLSGSLNILKKRLSTPFWGILTLIQHHFPKLWDFVYRKKLSWSQKGEKKKPLHKLKFFTPRLGQLNHYDPIELKIPRRYLKIKPEPDLPRLSIVTPSYNHAQFLERTIKSVLDQKYSNMEYIILDGNSNDGSADIIERYKNQLAYCKSEKDNGQADAINKGFQHSTGELMAWLNSDDVYLPGTFYYIVNYFNKNPDVDVVYGHRILIDVNDKETGRWILPSHDKKVLYYADFIPQETLFWRRRIWDKVGGCLDHDLQFALDWDLLLRFQEAGAIIKRAPRFLAAFRVHPQQKTSAQISSLGEKEMNLLRKKYLGRDVEYSEIKKKILLYLVKSEILHKFYKLKIFGY